MWWNRLGRGARVMVLATVAYIVLLCVLVGPIGFHEDTGSYFMAGHDDTWHGQVSFIRTPVYAGLAHGFAMLFGRVEAEWALVVLQLAIFPLAQVCLWRLTRGNLWINLLFLVVGAATQMGVVTEGLALTGITCLLYFCARYRQRPLSSAIVISLITIFLVGLRASLLWLLPIMGAWLLLSVPYRRSAMPLAIFIVLAVVPFLGYCQAFKVRFGVFTTTCVGATNMYEILQNADLLDPELIADPALRADVASDKPSIPWTAVWEYGLPAVDQAVKANIAARPWAFVGAALSNFLYLSHHDFPHQYGTALNFVINHLLLWLALGYVIVYLLVMWHRHSLGRLETLCCAMLMASLFVAVFGASTSYMRLCLPVFPAFLLLAPTVGWPAKSTRWRAAAANR